ncbi:MAG: hypothetical protein NZ555_16585, partial [Geminicoccaceae bacterium]|nr:hypothetical protein [Geminicoccaceae bacterium]
MNDGEVEIRRPPTREELDRPVAVRGGDWLAPEIVVGVARAGDAVLVLATGALVAAIGGFAPLGRSLLAWAMLTGLLFALCFWQLSGAYDEGLRLSMRARSVRVLSGWATALVALVALVRLTGSEELVPGAWLLAWGASAATGLLLFRAILGALERRWRRQGRLLRNVVVVGAGELGQRFVREVRRRDPSVRLIGLFDDRRGRVPQFVGGFPVLGTLDDLLLFARRHRVDEIVIALPWSAEGRILECLKKLRG